MIDLHYHATGLGEIDCDCCGTVLGFGFVDYADDCGFLCTACKIKLEHQEAPEIERQHFEMICRNLDYMFCDGHDWKDISYCTMVLGAHVFECTKCGAEKRESYRIIDWKLTDGDTVVPLKILDDVLGHDIDNVGDLKYEPWTKD